MVTDPVPRTVRLRRQFEESDARTQLPLPPAAPLEEATRMLGEALASENRAAVKKTGTALLTSLATFYGTAVPKLQVLGARPVTVVEGTLAYELFGDYTPSTAVIRVWMRTAVLGKVTSHRGLLNTLLHEYCHHLDVSALALPDTPHTRGFFARVDDLYHLALGTPPTSRRPLVWVRRGGLWHVDWRRLRGPRRT